MTGQTETVARVHVTATNGNTVNGWGQNTDRIKKLGAKYDPETKTWTLREGGDALGYLLQFDLARIVSDDELAQRRAEYTR